MTEFQQILQAFKDLNFNALYNLLDDNLSYMDVPKTTFLNALRKEVSKQEGLRSYDTIEVGTCNSCNKGCKAYKFKAKNQPSLDLFFDVKDGKVMDIYLCGDLKTENPCEDECWGIYFTFYKEEKFNFKPSIDYLIQLQRIEKAVDGFKSLKKLGLVPFKEVIYWFRKLRYLAEDLNLNDPFTRPKYKAHIEINDLYRQAYGLVHNYIDNDKAKTALLEYQSIDIQNEKELVKWLLKYENLSFYSLKETKNWKKTGILILETEPNLVLDCSGYLDAFIFEDIYNEHESDIMCKYQPTEEHYAQYKDGINCTLETFLRLHNQYLDLFF